MLTILSILCPPVAVLATGQPRAAVKTAGLTLLLFVPGVLYARREVERYTVCRQYEPVFRAMGA
ncbi:YqaE/Pmp3 family membrane protein [Limnoglobus roseus]|uniref:YqaE/Pmp3 family membrane protein n=1 Tax=Limnoglobus roseus TaxID=2598579 RepID=A0A5C1AMN7_9BACT|nr:YqaE/Pmp3 family membrane protein [Limnoglobus roseus]QEL18168.1 YqaE/Pmp3 family membrane protein [Limnoglobus roseus]